MSDAKKDLTELCRTHQVGPDLIEQSNDPGHLLDGVLETCDRLVATQQSSPESELSKLRGLIMIAREARTLETRTVTESSVRRLEQQLEQMECELRESETRAAAMQVRLHEILTDLDRGIPEGPQAGLENHFADLSRVCHKINNPLTSLLGRAQMLQIKLAKGDVEQTGKMVQVIEESAKRVAAYVQELAQVVGQGRDELLGKPDKDQETAG